MKKLISLCLTFILVIGCMGTVAYAEETLPGLLFDLDIQVTDAEAGTYTLKDASTTANNKAGKVIFNQGTTPAALGTNNWNTNYIQFGDIGESGAVNTGYPLQVDLGTDRNTDGGTNDSYANRDALTFETWVSAKDWETYLTAAASNGMFALTGRSNGKSWEKQIRGSFHPNFTLTPDKDNPTLKIEMRADTVLQRYGTEVTTAYSEAYKGSYRGINASGNVVATAENVYDAMSGSKWVHLVFVRKWTPSGDAGAGTWNCDIYVNGKKAGSGSENATGRVDYNNVSSGYWWIDHDMLLLGRMPVAGVALNIAGTATDPVVRIADFKMYDGELTEAQVKKNYDDTRAGFMDVPDVTTGTIEALEALERDASEFKVTFTPGVKAATVAEGSIKILDDNGNEVATKVLSYDEETSTATVQLLDYFAYGREYTLDVSGVTDLIGNPTARGQITFTTADKAGVEIIAPAEYTPVTATEAQVDLTVKNTDEKPLTIGMFIMVYGSDGKIKKLAMTKGDDIKTVAVGESVKVTVTTDGIEEGDEIRSMAYSIVEGKGRIAFTSPIELTIE